MNVTMLGVQLSPETVPSENSPTNVHPAYVFRYTISGVDHEKQFEFGIGKRVSVGRTANNDLSIDDVSVSKIHASFMAALGWWYAKLASAADFAAEARKGG